MSYARIGLGKAYEVDLPILGKKTIDLPVEEVGTDIGNAIEKELKASIPALKTAAIDEIKSSATEFDLAMFPQVNNLIQTRLVLSAVLVLGSIWGVGYLLNKRQEKAHRAIMRKLDERMP